MQNTLAVILAGGRGTRLEPLTRDRAKPAVPFGGLYRIIDFVLSNALNSGLKRLLVLTQYKAQSLDRHIDLAWRQFFPRELGEFIDVVPPQQRIADHWYQGTADAVYQNIYAIDRELPSYVVILAGDHIYKMNYRSMVEFHQQNEAEVTIGALRVPLADATQFGVMCVNSDNRIVDFQEKPQDPLPIPGDADHALASMGIYVFNRQFLMEKLLTDANLKDSRHDFGNDIIPSAIERHRVFAFPFRDENRKQDAYWRDVGTIDAYYQASMDLISVDPMLNLYDRVWPVRTHQPNLPPPKFVFGSNDSGMDGERTRRGLALDSIVCQGSIISGGRVHRSIIGSGVRVNSYAEVDDSILFEDVVIGRGAVVRRAILDKGASIAPGATVGVHEELDRRRNLTISSNGIVVVPRGERISD